MFNRQQVDLQHWFYNQNFMIVHFFILWLGDWTFFNHYLLNFNCPTTKIFISGHSIELLITKWFFFLKLSLTYFQSSNQWQGWSSPLIRWLKFFWSPRQSKKKITKKNSCLNFFHFQSLEYFLFILIASLVIGFFFPLNPCSWQPYKDFEPS